MIKKLLALALLISMPAASFGQICTPCSLQTVPGSPFTTAGEPVAIDFSPNCHLLAAALVAPTGSSVVIYPVNADCSLGTPVTIATLPNTSGNGAYQTVAFSPTGHCLAVGDSLGNVTIFSVSADCSTFTQILTPFASGGDNITKVAFSPNGNCLATSNFSSNSVSLFRVEPNCSLTLLPGSPFSTGSIQPTSVAFSPDGTYLVTTNDILTSPTILGSISIFCVTTDTAGNCSGLSTPPLIFSDSNIQTPELAVFSPRGNCLAIANGFGNCARRGVALYTLSSLPCDSTTGITPPTFNQQILNGSFTPAAAFSPFGGCLAVVDNCNNTVDIFTTNTAEGDTPPSCTLSTTAAIPLPISVGAGQLSPQDVVFSPNAQCLAVANRTNSISVFRTNILIPPVISVLVSCNTVTITGTTTPDVTVTALANGVAIGSDTSDASGNFSITATLAPGTAVITVDASNGVCTATSNSVTVSIVTLTPPVISVNGTTCFQTARITATTTVTPASIPVTISIFANGTLLASSSAVVNPTTGLATVVFPTVALPAGPQSIVAQAEADGCIVSSTTPVNIVFPPSCNFGATPNFALCVSNCAKPCR